MVETRSNYIRNHVEFQKPAPQLGNLARNPQQPGYGQQTWITVAVGGSVPVSSVTLHWRRRGPELEVAMFDDGQHGDGAANDGVFGQAIPPQPPGTWVEYFVSALATTGGTMSFLPQETGIGSARFQVGLPAADQAPKLNEFMARNTKGIKDEQGEYEDWVEIVNRTANPIDLGGMYLTDDLERPTKWQFPSSTVVQPGQFALVWCDEEPSDGPLHATFKLSNTGEDLALFDRDGNGLLDHIAFGEQVADIPTARLFDGTGSWATTAATPLATNDPPRCGSRIYSALYWLAHPTQLALHGQPGIGQNITLSVVAAAPQSAAAFFVGRDAAQMNLWARKAWLIAPPLFFIGAVSTDAFGGGGFGLQIPNDPSLVGARIYWQAVSPTANDLLLSNGLELSICP
jgi:hypothetical protein